MLDSLATVFRGPPFQSSPVIVLVAADLVGVRLWENLFAESPIVNTYCFGSALVSQVVYGLLQDDFAQGSVGGRGALGEDDLTEVEGIVEALLGGLVDKEDEVSMSESSLLELYDVYVRHNFSKVFLFQKKLHEGSWIDLKDSSTKIKGF